MARADADYSGYYIEIINNSETLQKQFLNIESLQ